MAKHNPLQELRALFHTEPNSDLWTSLCRCLEGMEPELLAVGLDYAEGHLEAWPDTLRIYACPYGQWVKDVPVWWPLVRTLSVSMVSDPNLNLTFSALHSPRLERLTWLNLDTNKMRAEHIEILANSPHLGRLKELRLSANHLNDDAVRLLASSRNLPALESLGLRRNEIGDEGAIALATSAHLPNLTHLELSINQVSNAGAIALAKRAQASKLQTICLYYNQIGNPGARAITKAAQQSHLCSARLTGNPHSDILFPSGKKEGSILDRLRNWWNDTT